MASSRIPLDEVLAKIGVGCFHMRLLWICGFGFSAAAVEVVLMSFVFPQLALAPWSLNEYQLGFMATAIGCGTITGTTLFGGLADRYGRRPVFMVTCVIVCVFGILSSFSPSYFWLIGLRFCVGFGYGGNIAVDFTLYSEFLPTEGRGKMMILLTFFWPLGQILAVVTAWVIIPRFGWQAFVAACTIPTIITAFARPFIPESPRWLLVQGRVEEATQVCCEMAEVNGVSAAEIGLGEGDEVCLDNENTGLEIRPETLQQRHFFFSLSRLFSPSLWQTTVGLIILGSSLSYTGYGTLTLMPRFLEMKGVSTPNMYRSMLLNSSAQVPGCFIAAFAGLYLGRLAPLKASIFVAGAALFGFALANTQLQITMCTMTAACFLEVGWATYHVYVAEVFPTECRCAATGFLAAAGSVVAILGPIMSAALITTQRLLTVVTVFASIAMLAGISSYLLLSIETKDRDLADVTSTSMLDQKAKGEPREC